MDNTARTIGTAALLRASLGAVDRRAFVICAPSVVTGLALGIFPEIARPRSVRGAELGAWIHIDPDDTVTVRVPTPEIGNGAMTQVAMNVTEELACDWAHVRTEMCSMQRDYLENGVYNSGFLPFFGGHGTDKVRMAHALQLGASARERLKTAAALQWRVPTAEIEARDSVLTHRSSGR